MQLEKISIVNKILKQAAGGPVRKLLRNGSRGCQRDLEARAVHYLSRTASIYVLRRRTGN